MRCLIVEDDDSAREVMSRMLERGGHRVVTAFNLESARKALEAGPVDVALLDLELPDGHGADAVAAIRSLASECRILVVSGYGDARHVIAALEAGADGYLLKDELAEALPAALQAVRAGHAPLSPRVAMIAIRRLRRPADEAAPVARLLPPPAKVV